MSKKTFKERSLSKCIELACRELNVQQEELTYTIIEETKGLFKKSVSIEVEEIDEVQSKEKDSMDEDNTLDGTIKIEDGNIFVEDPKEGGNPAFIIPTKNIWVSVDESECNFKTEVYKNSVIKVMFDENKASRNITIKTSETNMEAYISINYVPQNIYTLKDSKEVNCIELQRVLNKQVYPPIYTKSDIKEELNKLKIKYGIIEDNIIKCTSNENEDIKNLLVAKGKPVINDTDDVIDMKVNVNEDTQNFIEDNGGRIDFKSIGFINAVSIGDTIAIKHNGKLGEDGIDIYGNTVKHKKGKKISIKASQGCEIIDDSEVKATEKGKPCLRGNSFYVFDIHEVAGDVDLSTGNIKFVGDVIVHGNVREGMKIEAGNSIQIDRNVEKSDIIAKGDIVIRQNVIFSNITAGGEDVSGLTLIESLKKMKDQLLSLNENVDQIKEFNLLGDNVSDGEIIKSLLETKFKIIPKIFTEILQNIDVERSNEEERLVSLMKNKLIGFAPISIKNYREIDDIISFIEDNISTLENSLSIPVNLSIAYCQDSNIKSSGNINISGKGYYVSNLLANNSIYFTQDNSIARGGIIKAKNEIKCKVVGSPGGVVTKLIVGTEGHIWAETAYQNTLFVVGERQYSLEVSSKDVHAYLDKNSDIVVDKFVL